MSKKVILVVEDEPLLRMLAVDLVEAAGFEAIEAANAAEAITILDSRSDIHIVFTDIDMAPGIDGITLARHVRDRWPPVHIIVTSGHQVPQPGFLPDDARFFPKPYRENELIEAFAAMSAAVRS